MKADFDFVIYSESEAGHRGSYIKFISTIARIKRLERKDLFGASKPVFFLMIEESFALFVFVALIRSALGRRTAGLLFRPLPVISGSNIRLRFKYQILKLLKLFPKIQVLTILPFSVEPRFSEIADGWIYDFQLWDLSVNERKIVSNQCETAAARKWLFLNSNLNDDKKPLICAIGSQNRQKGFDVFAGTLVNNASIQQNFYFAFGGKVSDLYNFELNGFESVGGIAINRRVSDAELLDLYSSADIIWCYYSFDYDQASGVFGRAVQLGIPAIVREDSLIHKFCIKEDIDHIALGRNIEEVLLSTNINRNEHKGEELSKRFALISIKSLERALDVTFDAEGSK